jgi:hypothetical protein
MNTTKLLWAAALTAFVLPGCVLEKKDDDVGRFREAIPEAKAVEVSGPESAQSQTGAQSTPMADDEPWANGPWAKYYGFTRHVRQGVNGTAGIVLGSIWLIVHTQPSDVTENEAIWGPYTDALEPATYRFRVTEVAEDEYDYKLEGRPKGSSSDADYRAVLSGKGWGRGHEKHGDGFFEIDLDTAKALDSFNHGDDSGTVKITHDLPPDITSNLFSQPRSVTAEVYPSSTDEWFTATSNSREDGTGTLVVTAHADADDTNLTAKEDIVIASQWNNQGAGRADITITGGDVPVDTNTITAVECWDSDFYRVYYDDSVSYEATEGDAALCAFSEPMNP